MTEVSLLVEINAVLNSVVENEQKYSRIKLAIEKTEALPATVVENFAVILSDSEQRIIDSLLNLLDYLSGLCPEKLDPLFQSEDFFEKLSFLMWEYEHQDKISSLLKFWINLKQENEKDYPTLKSLKESFEEAGIPLPNEPDLYYAGRSEPYNDADNLRFQHGLVQFHER